LHPTVGTIKRRSVQALNIVLKHWENYKVEAGGKVRLAEVPADVTKYCDDKKAARNQVKQYRKQIDELLAVLAAEGKRSLLLILQGVDAAGKDGAVRRVFTGVNPQYCKVVSFKQPDREELAHDFLWRVYRAMPAKGELGVFNRSQYEDVLVPQARGELSRKEAHLRLDQIADMERTWSENGTVIRKFFLHISRKEQTERYKARLEDPEKHWKMEQSDFSDRKLWPKFQAVYEEILNRTSTRHAPWYVIPADHKWYSDVAIAGVVLATLRSMKPQVPIPRLDPKIFKL
jgi:PPK2 family polyphosphate:nucleotide phosphotransferase